jgi:hypothetical protein
MAMVKELVMSSTVFKAPSCQFSNLPQAEKAP